MGFKLKRALAALGVAACVAVPVLADTSWHSNAVSLSLQIYAGLSAIKEIGGNVYEKTNQCMYVSSDDERDQYVFICGAGS